VGLSNGAPQQTQVSLAAEAPSPDSSCPPFASLMLLLNSAPRWVSQDDLASEGGNAIRLRPPAQAGLRSRPVGDHGTGVVAGQCWRSFAAAGSWVASSATSQRSSSFKTTVLWVSGKLMIALRHASTASRIASTSRSSTSDHCRQRLGQMVFRREKNRGVSDLGHLRHPFQSDVRSASPTRTEVTPAISLNLATSLAIDLAPRTSTRSVTIPGSSDDASSASAG
jgi:hypothetical protein